MKPDQFLILARRLANEPHSGPSEYRTSISRSYYSAFHTIRLFVEADIKVSIKGASSRDNIHLLLQQFLFNSNVPEAVRMGRMLQDLHEARKAADYDLNLQKMETKVTAELSLQRVASIHAELAVCDKDPVKAKLIAGLTQYKKLRQGLS